MGLMLQLCHTLLLILTSWRMKTSMNTINSIRPSNDAHCYFSTLSNRFKSEYLASLRERHVYQSKKRGSQEEIIKVGDVVLVHAENVPRSSWKLAIVKKVLRGSDGLVRAAEIKTNSGVTNRSIHLLYPLEVTLTDPKEHFTGNELQIPQVETLRRSKRIASRPRPQYVESGD